MSLLSCPRKKPVAIDIISTLAKSAWLAVYMYIYFAWKIVAPKMSESLERTHRSGYLSTVTDICVHVFIKRSRYIDMGRHCVRGFSLVSYW